jgi:hypothetical protein
LLVASLALLVGQQAVFFAVFATMFAINERLMPEDPKMDRFFTVFTLEKGLVLGAAAVVAGLAMLVAAVAVWRMHDFGPLDYAQTMRLVIPAVTLTALGVQTVLGSFMISIMGMRRK